MHGEGVVVWMETHGVRGDAPLIKKGIYSLFTSLHNGLIRSRLPGANPSHHPVLARGKLAYRGLDSILTWMGVTLVPEIIHTLCDTTQYTSSVFGAAQLF